MSLPQQKYSLDVRHPFTRADARAAGITVKDLISSRYQKVFYNLYVSADVVLTPQVRARAALQLASLDSYASHHTAAELWGLPIPHDDHTHITVPKHGERLRRQGVKSHLGQGDARTLRTRIPVSTPEQTFIDLAASGVKLVDLVVLGDAMLKAKLTTVPILIESIVAWHGYGTRLALRAARLMREGVDSPMETRVRLLIVLAGLTEPTVNVIVRSEDGSWRMRFDLCYLDQRLIVEYDGRQHADSPEQWERDIYRREDLERMGCRLLIVTSRGVYNEPDRTLERVRAALRERGVRVPSRFKNEWRRHFPTTT
jgi:REase_MTES_1575